MFLPTPGALFVFVVGILAVSLMAGPERQTGQRKMEAELEPVFSLALAAPPELAAGALLRLAPLVADKDLRRDLLSMAFQLSGKAQNPVRLMPFPGTEATRTGSSGGAMGLKLDTLSIKSRVVVEMAALDPGRARDLFRAIARPEVSTIGCEGALVPDVSPYYEAVTAVAMRGFSQPERAKGEHIEFVTAALAPGLKIVDIIPSVRMLLSLGLTAEEFKTVLAVLAKKLDAMPPDARSFLYFSRSIEAALGALIGQARQSGVPADGVIDAYRRFLLNQFRSPHCADGGVRTAQLAQQTSLFGEAIRGGRPPIDVGEMTMPVIEGEMKLDRYWQSDAAIQLQERAPRLGQGPEGEPIADPARRAAEWKRQMSEFLRSLDEGALGGSDRDQFHQKAMLYETLLELLPPGELSDLVAGHFAGFLKSSDIQRQNVEEWLWRARSMVHRLRQSQPQKAERLLSEYQPSGNIDLMLEAMLDKAAPERVQPGGPVLP